MSTVPVGQATGNRELGISVELQPSHCWGSVLMGHPKALPIFISCCKNTSEFLILICKAISDLNEL